VTVISHYSEFREEGEGRCCDVYASLPLSASKSMNRVRPARLMAQIKKQKCRSSFSFLASCET
jgi:hypothetical protein